MAAIGKHNSINLVPPIGIVYLLFVVGLTALTYGLIMQNLLIAAVAALAPLACIIIYFGLSKPAFSYILYAIVSCYYSAIYRYAQVENLSVIREILLYVCIASIIINVTNNKERWEWKNAFNIFSLTYLLWLLYIMLSLLNPDVKIHDFQSNRGVFIGTPICYLVSGVLMNTPKKLRTTFLLLGLFVVTAAAKVYWQKSRGFDSTEIAWLMSGAWTTHLLKSGIRYFSFFTDAGNFGSAMGMFTTIFAIISIHVKTHIARIFCLGITVLAGIGMLMSGTRGAMIVPLTGMALYVILSKNIKIIISTSLMGAAIFSFFYFTDIGESNAFISRMRTAFRPSEDASFNVRLENQRRFAYYLKDKPFGVGVGGTIVDTRHLMNKDEEYIPTDSYFVGVWVQNGIVGLYIYIGILIVVLLRACYVLMFKIKHKQLRNILAALLCGIFGLWMNGYVGRGMGFLPSLFLIAMFMSFILNGPDMDKKLKPDEIIA
jgi:hypothetical protein